MLNAGHSEGGHAQAGAEPMTPGTHTHGHCKVAGELQIIVKGLLTMCCTGHAILLSHSTKHAAPQPSPLVCHPQILNPRTCSKNTSAMHAGDVSGTGLPAAVLATLLAAGCLPAAASWPWAQLPTQLTSRHYQQTPQPHLDS